MSKATEPKITASKGDDYTCITFYPDLKKFKMDALDKDIVDLFMRRAYDLTATCHGVKIFLNGKKLAVCINNSCFYYSIQVLFTHVFLLGFIILSYMYVN